MKSSRKSSLYNEKTHLVILSNTSSVKEVGTVAGRVELVGRGIMPLGLHEDLKMT
jgi:hypothetical protein